VLGFDDHCNARCAGNLLHRLGDFTGQVFLNLQAARIHIHNASDLRQAEYLAIGKIRNVCLADERQHVMLAQRVQLDILDQYHLAVI